MSTFESSRHESAPSLQPELPVSDAFVSGLARIVAVKERILDRGFNNSRILNGVATAADILKEAKNNLDDTSGKGRDFSQPEGFEHLRQQDLQNN